MEVNQEVCMEFFYHMFGTDIGELNIYRKESKSDFGVIRRIWHMAGDQKNKWKDAIINIKHNNRSRYWVSMHMNIIMH